MPLKYFQEPMPKVRWCSTQDVEFKVSPWRTKKKVKAAEYSSHVFSESIRKSDAQYDQASPTSPCKGSTCTLL